MIYNWAILIVYKNYRPVQYQYRGTTKEFETQLEMTRRAISNKLDPIRAYCYCVETDEMETVVFEKKGKG